MKLVYCISNICTIENTLEGAVTNKMQYDLMIAQTYTVSLYGINSYESSQIVHLD